MSASRDLELALRDARRFANAVTDWQGPMTPHRWRLALAAQDAADRALGYCGCPTCSQARDRELEAERDEASERPATDDPGWAVERRFDHPLLEAMEEAARERDDDQEPGE